MRHCRTVEIDAETQAEAEAMRLDLSEVLETALRQRISGQTFVPKPAGAARTGAALGGGEPRGHRFL